MNVPSGIRTSLILLTGLLLFADSGCTSLPAFSKLVTKKKTSPVASAEHPVVECICLWEAGEGTGLDGLPCRGFAGQILFFARGYSEPVRVDGDVTVYLFDDQGTPDEQGKPLHQYQFDSEAFQAFRTETNLGSAYQLFIPYPRKGTHRASCSLRVKVSPPYGNPVYSRMATVLLSGLRTREAPTSLSHSTRAERKSAVQRAGYEIEMPENSTGPRINGPVQQAAAFEVQAQQPDVKTRLSRALAAIPDEPDGTVVIERHKVSAAEIFHGEVPRIVKLPPSEPQPLPRHPLLDE